MSLSIGKSVSGYELLDYVDSSTSRVTYRARNESLHRIEQLQVLPDSLLGDSERSARFFRESRILSNLKHPNILTCYGTVELAGHLAISVESLDAVTLADRLELGPFPIEDGVRIILQVIAAVDAAHSAGVLHREISSKNVLITPDGIVKLTGFASAKSLEDPNLTAAGSLFGDASWKAPELFQGYTALDPRIDVYSIGCLFYAVVTGRPPFTAASEYDLMMAHLRTEPEPPSRKNPAVNSVLDAVIIKAIAKDPGARYQSAREFYHCILNPNEVYQPPPDALFVPASERPVEAESPASEPMPAGAGPAVVPPPPTSPIPLPALAAAAGLLLLAALIWLYILTTVGR